MIEETARLAVIVGHTATVPGMRMVAPLASPEYFWNVLVAEAMDRHMKRVGGAYLKIFTRDMVGLTRTYKNVNAWGATLALELHCNAFDGKVRGTETLYGGKHPKSEDLAKAIQKSVCTLFERDEKGDRGIKKPTETERGFWNVNLANCPSVLIEPFFGDSIEECTRAKLKEADYPITLVETLLAFAKEISVHDRTEPPSQPTG